MNPVLLKNNFTSHLLSPLLPNSLLVIFAYVNKIVTTIAMLNGMGGQAGAKWKNVI